MLSSEDAIWSGGDKRGVPSLFALLGLSSEVDVCESLPLLVDRPLCLSEGGDLAGSASWVERGSGVTFKVAPFFGDLWTGLFVFFSGVGGRATRAIRGGGLVTALGGTSAVFGLLGPDFDVVLLFWLTTGVTPVLSSDGAPVGCFAWGGLELVTWA